MEAEIGVIYRGNFLLVQEYLAYLLKVRLKNPESVERYRFWLNHLLFWAMEVPLPKARSISTPFSDYVRSKNLSQESQKKTVETARAFLRWAKLYHEKQFASLPAYWVADLTPVRVHRQSVSKYVRLDEVLKIGHKTPGKDRMIVGGMSNKEIAFALDVTENTVKSHVQNIFGKIGVSDRTSAATTAIRRGLVRVDL